MQPNARLVTTAAVLILAGCAASPGTAPARSEAAGTLLATGDPLPTIVAQPTSGNSQLPRTPAPPDPILLGSAVRVAVAELNLREAPTATAPKVVVLTPENVVRVLEGPVHADGYTWYGGDVVSRDGTLPPLPQPLDGPGDPAFGWLAVAKGSTSYVTRVAPRCPTTVDLVNVAAQLRAERLECFGSERILVEGVFGCEGCDGSGEGLFEPSWLAQPLVGDLLSVAVDDVRALWLRFPPDRPPAPPEGSILRVTGHFDDPAAQTCRIARPQESPVPIDPAIAILQCREEFVVDSFEVRGVDPNFRG